MENGREPAGSPATSGYRRRVAATAASARPPREAEDSGQSEKHVRERAGTPHQGRQAHPSATDDEHAAVVRAARSSSPDLRMRSASRSDAGRTRGHLPSGCDRQGHGAPANAPQRSGQETRTMGPVRHTSRTGQKGAAAGRSPGAEMPTAPSVVAAQGAALRKPQQRNHSNADDRRRAKRPSRTALGKAP